MDYQNICREVVAVSRSIGDWMWQERKKFSEAQVETKSFNNLVSYVDKTSEEKFVKELLRILPESGILGEEGSNSNLDNDFIWIIDPLDGTTNYVHGIPAYCTSVALQHKGTTVLGVVYEPNNKECFYAWKGSPAYCNENEIHVSDKNSLKTSLLATGFPYDDFSKMENYIDILKFFMKETRGVRRIGAAALDLCYVASGIFDGFYEYALQPWDVAAGAFIVQQAGGKISDFSNGENFIKGGEIIAANSHLHETIQKKVDFFFNGQ